MSRELIKFLQFSLVGLSNTVIDFSIFNLLLFVQVNLYLAASLSFLIAVINSYIWNRHWTFSEHKSRQVGTQFSQFLIVNLIGLAINNGIVYLALRYSPFEDPILTANGAKLVAIALVVMWNFGMSRWLVFRPPGLQRDAVQTS